MDDCSDDAVSEQLDDEHDISSSSLNRYGNFRRSLHIAQTAKVTLADLINPWIFFSLFSRPQIFVIQWLQEQKVLASTFICPKCDVTCILTHREARLDRYTFRCPLMEHEYTVRKNSFFFNFRFPFQDVMVFLLGFLDDMSLYRICEKAGVNYSNAGPKWAMIIRKVMIQSVWSRYFASNPFKLSGTIQADESKFGHVRKNFRGEKKCNNDIWVFGLTCSRTDRTLLFPVEKRSVLEKIKYKFLALYYFEFIHRCRYDFQKCRHANTHF